MHPVMTMKTWAHEHHVSTRHEMAESMSRWIHGERFWPVAGLILAFGFMFLLMYLAIRFGPATVSTVNYNPPYFFWMH